MDIVAKRATSLNCNVDAGHFGVVSEVLKHQATVNAVTEDGGVTPLYAAAKRCNDNVVRVLLEHHAKVNFVFEQDKLIPLYIPIMKHVVEVVHLPTKDGAASVLITAYTGLHVVAKLLLEHDADPDTSETNGSTPRFVAMSFKHVDVARVLLGEMPLRTSQTASRTCLSPP